MNRQTGKVLAVAGGSTSAGAAIQGQSAYSGTASQLWSFQSVTSQPGNYEISPSAKMPSSIWPAAGNTLDGAGVAAVTHSSADIQTWNIVPIQ
jgi:hypothetical protein